MRIHVHLFLDAHNPVGLCPAVGGPMEAIGLLFCMCSFVCQVADPSLMAILMGLLLDGLPPRARGKQTSSSLRHEKTFSFDGKKAPDTRKAAPYGFKTVFKNYQKHTWAALVFKLDFDAFLKGSRRK